MGMSLSFLKFQYFAQNLTQIMALVIDLIAMVIIVYAALRAFRMLLPFLFRGRQPQNVQNIRYHLGRSLVLGLEFLIGADILRTSIAPSWTIIGQLGAIILLRTLLDYLLERELRDIQGQEGKISE